MRIVSYNIWDGGVNEAGGDRQEKLLGILQNLDPDLLLLTEACGFTSPTKDPFQMWQKRLGMKGEMIETSSGFHLALLAKDPITITSVEAVHKQIFYHGCLSAQVKTPLGDLLVLGVHLNPFDPESRLSETRHISREAHADKNVILLGDFNSFSPSDEVHESLWKLPPRILARHIRDTDHPKDFDSRALAILEYAGFTDLFRTMNPQDPGWTIPTDIGSPFHTTHMRLDYMFATEPMAKRVSKIEVLRTAETKTASDHFPLVCDFGTSDS